MKSPFIALAFVLLGVEPVSTQETPTSLASQMPTCAMQCLSQTVYAAGCGIAEFDCQCSHSAAINDGVTACLAESKACSPAEIEKATEIAIEICRLIGANVTSATLSALSSATGTGTLAPTSSTLTSDAGGKVDVAVGLGAALLFGLAL